ncbi:hypothetical protein MARINOS108_20412 [Marinoscillum sp. 108]|nr:hypothetical protein MARINOS108_20412 [Marinoscillum sp. 108]
MASKLFELRMIGDDFSSHGGDSKFMKTHPLIPSQEGKLSLNSF